MLKSFFKDTAIYGITSIIARGLSLLLLPFYTRVFTPYDYGIIDILSVITNLVNLTVALEISQGVARYYTDAETPKDKIAYASSALWFTVVAYTIFFILSLIFSRNLSHLILGDDNHQKLFIVALITMFLSGILYLTQNQLRWQLQAKDYALTNLVFTVISPITVAVLVLVYKLGLISVFYANIFAYSVAILLALYFTRQSYKLIFDWSKCREMLIFSAPLVLSSISVFVALYIDRIAIQQLLSLKEVGLYGIGYRFASVVGILLSGFQASLTPLIYNNYQKEETPKNIATIFNIYCVFMFSITLFFILFAKEIVYIFTTKQYYPAYPAIPLITIGIILSNTYVFAPGLSIAKKTQTIAVINITTAITNTVLNFLLIPVLGFLGAGVGTIISASLSLFLYIKHSQNNYFIPYKFKKKIPLILWGLGISLLTLFLSNFSLPSNLLLLIAIKLMILIAGVYGIVESLIGAKKMFQTLQDFVLKKIQKSI